MASMDVCRSDIWASEADGGWSGVDGGALEDVEGLESFLEVSAVVVESCVTALKLGCVLNTFSTAIRSGSTVYKS